MDVHTLYNITVNKKIIAVNGNNFYFMWRIVTAFVTLCNNFVPACVPLKIITPLVQIFVVIYKLSQ